MSRLIKCFLLIVPIFMVSCNAQSFSPESQQSNEETINTADVHSINNNSNGKKKIILYMGVHDLWGLEKSSKSDAYYYRVLIKELPNDSYLVQDFFISGVKFTDPYILTDGHLEYTDNEDVAHPDNYYPREGARTVWFESGNKKIESHYKDNMPIGIWMEYFENGQKRSEDPYSNGVLHGITKSWNEQGDLTGECTYSHGVENGRCYVKYSLHPNIYIYDITYKNGKKISISKSWNIDGTIEEFTFNGSLSLQEIKKGLAEDQFEIFTFDVNADGMDDLIISRINDASNDLNLHQGDELFVLIGDKNGKYKLSLNTSNYTDDGGWFFYDIYPRTNRSGFILKNYFSNRGNANRSYYFNRIDNKWIISKYVSDGTLITGEDYYCVENNKLALSEFKYGKSSNYSQAQFKEKCPPLPIKYHVKTDRAEILSKSFKSMSPPNYYIKGDSIEAFDQNEDWVKVSYKNGTKFGWIDKRNLSPVLN